MIWMMNLTTDPDLKIGNVRNYDSESTLITVIAAPETNRGNDIA